MAFSKAERTLDLCTNYNPPPNYYQHQPKPDLDEDQIHATFAKESRFKSQLKKNSGEPGPGHYYHPSKPTGKGHKIVAPKGAYSPENEIKINSIPSIPQQSTARAYEELAPGILILHEAEEEEGEIGPGSYDPKPVMKKVGGNKFSTTPYDRFQKKKEEEPRVYYPKPQHPKINMKEKIRQPQRKIINQSDLCLEMIILREKQLKIDEIPPPGYYHNERVTSGFVIQEKPKDLQFLAGKAERFKDTSKESGVGPGQYQLVSVNKLSEGGFFAKANRNTAFGLETKNNPGPGAYIQGEKHEEEMVSATKHPPIFSSGCVRFISTVKESTPGPGQYNIDKSNKRRKMTTIRVPIQSKTSKSFNTKQKLSSEANNSKYFSTESNKRGATVTQKMRKESSAFASRLKRFKDTETSFVGPGLYNINPKVRTKFNRRSNVIEQEERFKYHQNVTDVGPGYYDVNDDRIKAKKTHDIIFK